MPMDTDNVRRRIEELRRDIRRHDQLYYVEAAPVLSDQAYDALYRELVDLETAHPVLVTPDSPTRRVGGAPLDHFETRSHAVPMMSLDNTYSEDELRLFERRIRERAGQEEPIRCTVEPKIDGVSLSLRYEDGLLVQALTRGNGREGDDVTANVRTIRTIPLRLTAAQPPTVWEVRGEVFMGREEFAALNQTREARGESPFANARNATAGTLKLLDPKTVASRPLDAVFYGPGEIVGVAVATQEQLRDLMISFGLETPAFFEVVTGLEAIIETVERLGGMREQFPYDIDGAVIKVSDCALRDRLGATARAPSWAIAYKYAAERARTRLRAITVQVGRLGTLTPVAELEPVFLAGSTVSRATLHNEDDVKRKDVRVGDVVEVAKAGEVIPAVVGVVKEERVGDAEPFDLFEFVAGRCPSCGGEISRDPQFVAWRCENLHCPAQAVRRLEHFVARNAMDIEGIGGIVAERLVDRGLVREPLDLFTLQAEQLASLNLGTADEPRVFGAKNAAKVLEALARARGAPLARWLHAIGIPNVGAATAEQIAACHPDLESVATSRVLQDTLNVLALQGEARRANPAARDNRGRPENERLALVGRMSELSDEARQIGTRLAEAGLARLKTDKEDRHGIRRVEYLTEIAPSAAQSVLDFFASGTGTKILATLNDMGIHPAAGPSRAAGEARSPLAGKTVVITGTLPSLSRDQARDRLRAAGAKVTDSVSSNTAFLVAGENAGSKLQKARELDVTILSEAELLEMTDERVEETPPEVPPVAGQLELGL